MLYNAYRQSTKNNTSDLASTKIPVAASDSVEFSKVGVSEK